MRTIKTAVRKSTSSMMLCFTEYLVLEIDIKMIPERDIEVMLEVYFAKILEIFSELTKEIDNRAGSQEKYRNYYPGSHRTCSIYVNISHYRSSDYKNSQGQKEGVYNEKCYVFHRPRHIVIDRPDIFCALSCIISTY